MFIRRQGRARGGARCSHAEAKHRFASIGAAAAAAAAASVAGLPRRLKPKSDLTHDNTNEGKLKIVLITINRFVSRKSLI